MVTFAGNLGNSKITKKHLRAAVEFASSIPDGLKKFGLIGAKYAWIGTVYVDQRSPKVHKESLQFANAMVEIQRAGFDHRVIYRDVPKANWVGAKATCLIQVFVREIEKKNK